jgi:hypothetical protein
MYSRQNCSQEFLADFAGYLASHRVEFRGQPGGSCGRGGEVRADCGRGRRPGPGSGVPDRRHHHAVLVLRRARRALEPQARHHRVNAQLVCLIDSAAIYISDPRPGCTHDAKAFGTTPVAEIVAHSGGGIVDKGAEASAMAKRLIVCCDGTWNTLNQVVRGNPCPTHSARWRGDCGHRQGGMQQRCFYEEGRRRPVGATQGRSVASTRSVTRTLPRPQLRAGR